MSKKKNNWRGKLAQRFVVGLFAFMLALICVLSFIAAAVVKEAVMEYTNAVAFTAANGLVDEERYGLIQYREDGKIEEDVLASMFVSLYETYSDWELLNCFIAIPKDDGLLYIFGYGDRIMKLYDENNLYQVMEYLEPYSEGMEEWIQRIIEAQSDEDRELLEYYDAELGHIAYAAEPIYDFSEENLVGMAFVEMSVEGVYALIMRTTKILAGAIALITMIFIAIYCQQVVLRTVKPIHTLNNETLMIKDRLSAGEVYRSNIHTGDEIEELSRSIEQMSCELRDYIAENSRNAAERERFKAELDTAARIQASQLPNVFPAFPDRVDFDLYAYMKPAKMVGGDFYDFFLVDDDHIALVMADVSGKGVPAALFMMTSKTLIKEHLIAGHSPAETLKQVNARLLETNRTRQFVTVWLAVVELSTGRGVAANAGHEHPALRRADGDYELIVYKHSPPVAATKLSKYRDREFELNPGDSLFVYTDGVAEATDASDVLFGTDRMLAALNGAPDADPEATIANVRDAMRAFVGEADQFDDITMLCLRYNGPQGARQDA